MPLELLTPTVTTAEVAMVYIQSYVVDRQLTELHYTAAQADSEGHVIGNPKIRSLNAIQTTDLFNRAETLVREGHDLNGAMRIALYEAEASVTGMRGSITGS